MLQDRLFLLFSLPLLQMKDMEKIKMLHCFDCTTCRRAGAGGRQSRAARVTTSQQLIVDATMKMKGRVPDLEPGRRKRTDRPCEGQGGSIRLHLFLSDSVTVIPLIRLAPSRFV